MIQPISVFLERDLSEYKKLFRAGAKNEGRKTLDVPVAFDIETSTDGAHSWLYAFGFSFDGKAYLGRTWDDFRKILDKLMEITPERHVVTIFVHNLGYEFFFFKHRFGIKNAFFKSAKKPILVELSDPYDGIVLKDSCQISGYSLREWAEISEMKTKKGDLDYTIIRTPTTILTAAEMSYIERDVLIIDEGIRKLVQVLPYDKKVIGSIPLTKTQLVKTEMLHGCMASYTFKKICRESQFDVETLEFMRRCFRGGSIGATCPCQIMNNMTRYDISSQYPFELLTRKYPFGRYDTVENPTPRDLKNLLEYDHLFIIEFQVFNLKRKPGFPKFLQSERAQHFYMTSIDFRIFKFIYDFEIVRINKITFWWKSDLVFPQIRNFILRKYKTKTKLKGIAGREFEYEHEKSNLNTVAGLVSTFPIRDNFTVTGQKIDVDPEQKLEDYYNGMARLPYSIGLFMVSYARASLWNAIQRIGPYATVYFDTDCVDTIGDCDDIIDELNKKRLEILKRIGYNEDDISPEDSFGVRHTIGFFEKKWTGARFCAISPKCYAAEIPGVGLKAVVGGCSIDRKIEYVKSLEQFESDDLVIPGGLKSSEYIDEPFEIEISGEIIREKSYINIHDVDFEMKRIKALMNFSLLEEEE